MLERAETILLERARLIDWQQVFSLLAGAALAFGVVVFSRWIAQDASILSLVALFLALAVGTVMFIFLGNWRVGIYPFLIWLLFEDLPRKFLGNNMLIYFGKDALVGIAYIAFLYALGRGRVKLFRAPFMLPLLLFVWWGLLQVFNPNSPSFYYGFLGLKLYFYYIPLMFLGFAFLRGEKDLRRFLVFNMAIAAVIATIGIIQAIVGLDFLTPAVLAPELRELGNTYRRASTTGFFGRPTAVFVSDGRFAWYMLLALILGLGALGYVLLRRQKGRFVIVTGLALVVAAILLSGSRWAFMFGFGSIALLIPTFIWGMPRGSLQRRRATKAIRRMLTLAAVAVVAIILAYPEQVGLRLLFYHESFAPWSPKTEFWTRIWSYPLDNFMLAFEFEHWPIGYGLGTASLGVQYVTSFFNVGSIGGWVENGYGNLIVELGLLGPLLWLLWSGAYTVTGWLTVRRLRGTSYFPIGLCFFWFGFLLIVPFTYFGMQSYQNYFYNAYFWLLTGMLYKLPELAAVEAAARAQAQPTGGGAA